MKQLKIAAAKTLVMEGQVKRSEGKGVPIHPATDRLEFRQHFVSLPSSLIIISIQRQ